MVMWGLVSKRYRKQWGGAKQQLKATQRSAAQTAGDKVGSKIEGDTACCCCGGNQRCWRVTSGRGGIIRLEGGWKGTLPAAAVGLSSSC